MGIGNSYKTSPVVAWTPGAVSRHLGVEMSMVGRLEAIQRDFPEVAEHLQPVLDFVQKACVVLAEDSPLIGTSASLSEQLADTRKLLERNGKLLDRMATDMTILKQQVQDSLQELEDNGLVLAVSELEMLVTQFSSAN